MHKPFFAWQDSYSVGHPELDAQHRQLVALINEIHSAECSNSGRNKLQALLHAFEIQAINHYRNENSIIELLGIHAQKSSDLGLSAPFHEAPINEHYAEHARSLVELESIVQASDAELGTRNFSLLLKAWFTAHASVDDVDLKSLFAIRSREG